MKNLFRISDLIPVMLLILLFPSCKKKEKLTLPTITTTTVTEISYTTATSGGDLTDIGGAYITARGICWNNSVEPTILNSKTTENGGLGTFSSNITQLLPGTSYYVRAYATNIVGTSYGNEVSFATIQVAVPVLTTTAITSITQTTAVSGGNITDDKGGSVTARGVCWGTTTNPTTANNKTTDGTGTGSFVSYLPGIQPGTIYFVRAYATNSAGTSYGNEISFTTLATLPTLTTTAATLIAQTTATSGGNITSNGGATVTASGVCWSTTANPVATGSHTTDGTTTGVFSSSITGLTANTLYYVRAYATNSVGTAYGNEVSFTTLATLPTLTTTVATLIAQTTATSGGNITSNGGATVTASGVCWSTTANPVATGSHTTDGTATGVFTSSITGLTASTIYYVRAYATNSVGTAYGNEVSFITNPTITVTDIDGNIYNTVTIGTQVWMMENLKTTKYRNNDPVPNITNTTWTTVTTGAYCWYNNDIANKTTYGALYNHYTVVDSRNLCPTGWHVPTNAEWTTLTDYLTNNGYGYGGSGSDIGKSLAATSGWTIFGTAGTIGNDQASNNSSGFTALPGGFRGASYSGYYDAIGSGGYWWAATEGDGVWSRSLYYSNSGIGSTFSGYERFGYSVRCLRDL